MGKTTPFTPDYSLDLAEKTLKHVVTVLRVHDQYASLGGTLADLKAHVEEVLDELKETK